MVVLRENTAALDRLRAQPRTSYVFWDKDWSGSGAAMMVTACCAACIVSSYALALMLPEAWIAVPTADALLKRDEQAICSLMDHHHGTRYCHVRRDGEAGKVTLEATIDPPGGKR